MILWQNFRGEVLEISECKIVKTNKIFWGNKMGSTCYERTPVEVNGEIFFIKAGTKDLMKDSAEISCNETSKPIFRLNDTWNSLDSNSLDKHVEIFPNLLSFQYINSTTIFKAQTPYDHPSSDLYDSLTILSRYANRINVLNDIFNENNIIVNDTNILADLGELIENFDLTNGTIIPEWFSDPIGKIKEIFSEWINVLIIIGIIIIIFLLIGIILYTYSWWIWIFKLCKICRRRGKYKINNVSAEPSAPPEPEAFILDYIPRSYMLSDRSPKLLIISIGINGHNFNALVDTGSNISFVSTQLLKNIKSEDLF